jgi:hypothetical protein
MQDYKLIQMRFLRFRNILFFLFLSLLGFSQNATSTKDSAYNKSLLKQEDLSEILRDSDDNEKLILERLTAFFFHNLINEYRISSDKSWLFWNENLWLAARNHNVYMINEKDFGHFQNPDSKLFTGINPKARLSYVTGISRLICGENVHYSGGGNSKQTDMAEIAQEIAQESFKSWQNSPGHNKNMLNNAYNTHGTSFLINDKKIIATTVFQENKNFQLEEITITWDSELANQNIPNFIIKDNEVYSSKSEKDLSKIVCDIIKSEFLRSTASHDRDMDKAAKKHVKYMIANNNQSSIEERSNKYYYAKTPKKRYLKAAGNFKWVSFMFTKVYDKSIILNYPLKDFINPDMVFTDIGKKINKFLPHRPLIEKWGTSVSFYKEQDQYVCVLNFVYIIK